MNSLRRRIAKLERTLTDASGRIPGSPAWRKYWFAEIDRGLATEFVNSPLLPLEAVRMWMRAQPDESQS
jgi:hypothetical protein